MVGRVNYQYFNCLSKYKFDLQFNVKVNYIKISIKLANIKNMASCKDVTLMFPVFKRPLVFDLHLL